MTSGSTAVQALLSPRAVAGGGNPAVTVPIHRAAGWSHGQDPLLSLLLSSPYQQTLLRLEPNPDGQWWTLQHTRTSAGPGWSASFGAWTPVEISAALTDTPIRQPGAPAESDPYTPARGERQGTQAVCQWSPVCRRPDHDHEGPREGSRELAGHDPRKEERRSSVAGLVQPSHAPASRHGVHTGAGRPGAAGPGPLGLPPNVRGLSRRRAVPAEEVAHALEHRVQQLTSRPSNAPEAGPRAPRGPAPHRRTR